MDEEVDDLCADVEDIMCDQVIISTELDMNFHSSSSKLLISYTKLRLAVTVITKTVLPAVVGVYYAYLKNQKVVVENVKRQIFPAVLAFLVNSISCSLSSVQKGITYPLTLKQLLNKQQQCADCEEETPEKCVECTVLYTPEEYLADVIFIHGLHGSVVKTWRQGMWRHEKHKLRHERLSRSASEDITLTDRRKSSLKRTTSETYFLPSKVPRKGAEECIGDSSLINMEGSQEYSNCWPKDWIPKDCPGARVIAVNYTTDPYLWRPLWVKKRNRTNLVERSREIIQQLMTLGVGEKPIVWVGHSKGGLFIKQLMIEAWENTDPDIQRFYIQTKGLMFYSVPHRGSSFADLNLPLIRQSVELKEIQRNCSFVLDLHEKFLKLLDDPKFMPEIFSFIETSYTLMSFLYLRIVPFESADPNFGIRCGVPLDHREICKPAGRDCFLYIELIKLINSAIADSKSAS